MKRSTYTTAPVGLCYLDRSFRFVEINEWLARYNGPSIREHLGRTVYEIVPDVAKGITETLNRVAETGEPVVNGSVAAKTPAHPDEERRYEHNFFPDFADNGTVIGFNIVVWDVTNKTLPLNLPNALSDREREVVLTLAQSTSVSAVAGKLGISPNTARNHLKSVYRKLNVNSQTELLSLVLRGASHT